MQIFDQYRPSTDEYSCPTPLDIHEIIINKAGYWANSTLDLIPSRLELSRTLKNSYGKERRLAEALSKVFKLLASLDKRELEELSQEQDKTNFSSLGIISDEIMKRPA